jgi:hypothetical protein
MGTQLRRNFTKNIGVFCQNDEGTMIADVRRTIISCQRCQPYRRNVRVEYSDSKVTLKLL